MDEEDAHWNLSNVSVVILGAGFSCAVTDGRMPLMANFFRGIDRCSSPTLVQFIESTQGDPDTANVEKVLLALDQIRTSPRSVLEGWADKWFDQSEILRGELTTYTLNRLKSCSTFSPDNWAANILAGCGSDTTIISMNYDTLADRILSCRPGIIHHGYEMNCPHCKMRELLYRACSCSGNKELTDDGWRGALLKPHGSIAWRRCLNAECCNYECLVADHRCRPYEPCSCPDCGNNCFPVIVMPTMSKHLDEVPEIGVMWQASRRAIAEAESICIFGFSFPPSDELFVQMIRSSIHSTQNLNRLAVIDLKPHDIGDRFGSCVPENCEVIATAFPVSGLGKPDWFVDTRDRI